MVRNASRSQAGMVDPFEKHHKRPLAEHIADFRQAMEADGCVLRYCRTTHTRLTWLAEGCGFRFITDVSASKAQAWLAQQRQDRPAQPLPAGKTAFFYDEALALLGIAGRTLRSHILRHRLPTVLEHGRRMLTREAVVALQARLCRGSSIETTNQALCSLKAFCRWLVEDGRTGANPVLYLDRGNIKVDRRHDRRDLAADELRLLLATTRASARIFRGLTGEDRFHLYACACGTGFRVAALASLFPEAFDLDADTPTVTLAVRSDKSRRGKIQPLPADVAELLRVYLRGKPAGEPVWPGPWVNIGAEMLRHDLADAGIPYRIEGPNGPLFFDMHAMRHTYLTLAGRAGVDLRTLQELAGHSSPVVTARYVHVRLHDAAGAVGKIPSCLPESGPTRRRSGCAPPGPRGQTLLARCTLPVPLTRRLHTDLTAAEWKKRLLTVNTTTQRPRRRGATPSLRRLLTAPHR